ncbi:MAG: hypothetical protein JWQ98_2245 [Chlorobi bacterium]|nr:hypothetical protein [Chlorobiota bacterium]
MITPVEYLQQQIESTTRRYEKLSGYSSKARCQLANDPALALESAECAVRQAKSIGKAKEIAKATQLRGICRLALADDAGALRDIDEAYGIFLEEKEYRLICGSLLALGDLALHGNQRRVALNYYKQSLKMSTRREYPKEMASAEQALGHFHTSIGDYAAGLEYFHNALALAERIGRKDMLGTVYSDIADLHCRLGEDDNGLEWYAKARDCFRAAGERLLEARALSNIASVHYSRGDVNENLQEAEDHALLALEGFRLEGARRGLAVILSTLGNISEKFDRSEEAISYQEQAAKYIDALHDRDVNVEIILNIGNLYRKLRYYGKAIDKLEEGRFQAAGLGDKGLEARAHELLAITHEELQDFQKALEHHKTYARLRDEIWCREKQREVAELQTRFNLDQARRETELYREQTRQLEQQHSQQTNELKEARVDLVEKDGLLEKLLAAVASVEQPSSPAKKSSRGASQRRLSGMIREVKSGKRTTLSEWEKLGARCNGTNENIVRMLREKFPTLSRTEVKVCALTKMDMTTQDIAGILHVVERTVETHRYRILRKLDRPKGEPLSLFLDGL